MSPFTMTKLEQVFVLSTHKSTPFSLYRPMPKANGQKFLAILYWFSVVLSQVVIFNVYGETEPFREPIQYR